MWVILLTKVSEQDDQAFVISSLVCIIITIIIIIKLKTDKIRKTKVYCFKLIYKMV